MTNIVSRLATRRFIMARRLKSDAVQAAPLILVENRFEELKRKLGQ